MAWWTGRSRPKEEALRETRPRAVTAPGLALIYLVFGLVWIFASSYVGPRLEPDIVSVRTYEIIKGSAFVVLSAVLVFSLARRGDLDRMRQRRRAGRFQALVDTVPDMVFWLSNADGSELLYVSPAVERILGLPREKLYEDASVFWNRLHPEDEPPPASSEHPLDEDREYRIVRPDGEVDWLHARVYPVRESHGPRDLAVGVLQTITDRKEAFDAVREQEKLLRRAQRIGRLGHWRLELETGELTWSDEVFRIFGLDPAEFEPDHTSFLERVHPDDRAEQEAADRALLAGGASLDLRNRIVRPDGEIRHVHERASVEDVAAGYVLGTVQDVTAQVRLEEELARSRDVIREWAAEEVSIREQERIEIAREIHDELGQLLTALKMQIEQERRQSKDGAHERLERTTEIVDDAIRVVRTLAKRLRPPTLDQLGLIGALEEHVEWFQRSSSVETRFVTNVEEIELGTESATHLFRIVQEALTNVARHADADRARVELRKRDDELVLRVSDDGVGPGAGRSSARAGHGVIGMRERAMVLGGTLQLAERDSGGTTVTVRVPTMEARRT